MIKCGAEDIYFAYACDLMQENLYIFKGPYYQIFSSTFKRKRFPLH